MDSERPFFTFGVVIGFHSPLMSDSQLSWTAAYKFIHVRWVQKIRSKGGCEDFTFLHGLCLKRATLREGHWVCFECRDFYSIKSTGMYLGLELPISCFYFSAFIWMKQCTLSCWSLGVDVEVSSSLSVFWMTIWHNNATLWYMIMGKLAKCIIPSYLKTMFETNSFQFSMLILWHQYKWHCGLYC